MVNLHSENEALLTIRSVLLYSVFPFVFSLATNIISPDQPLHDGQTLVSTGNEFELGFFSPNGSSSRYVGLWFKQFPESVVWVANRDNPLIDLSEIMMIDGLSGKSNLFIIDGLNNTVWSALNETNDGDHREVKNAELHTLGNLILFGINGSQLWQSFEHPTDTILPRVKIGINRQTGEDIFLSTWKNVTDPSTGSFRGVVDVQRPPQIYVLNGSAKHYRTGQWNGRDFIGDWFLDDTWPIGYYTITYVPEKGILYFGIADLNYSNPVYGFLNTSGYIVLSTYVPESRKFVEFSLPDSPCGFYGTCGSFGWCDDDDKESSQICSCLTGYVPKNATEWDKGNWKEGCRRKEKLGCEKNLTASQDVDEYGFLEHQSTKLSDLGVFVVSSGDKDSCEAACLRNCSCAAYAFVDAMGCMLWDDLIDVQRFSTGGESFYLKLPLSELGTKKKSKGSVIALIVPLAKLGLCQWRTKRRRSVKGDSDIYDIRREGNSEVRSFSYKDIEAATDKFSSANKLGEGGFGPVYKGKLINRQVVAVKRLSSCKHKGVSIKHKSRCTKQRY